MRKRFIATFLMSFALGATGTGVWAQRVVTYSTTEGAEWKEGKTAFAGKAEGVTVVTLDGNEEGVPFRAWGTTFNELDWDAFNLLTRDEQDEVMRNLYSPTGDLRFTHGRVSMNANDYARSWYSCDDVVGDLGLKYFNIERDKRNIIPLARAAQKYCPQLQLFMSPWSPPAWMKINQDYPVSPSKHNTMDSRQGYLLYMDEGKTLDPDEMKLLGDRNGVFPRRLASQDFFIQDPRYLQCYAEMFCRFIDLYAEQGLPITKVMYQNEAYSYTLHGRQRVHCASTTNIWHPHWPSTIPKWSCGLARSTPTVWIMWRKFWTTRRFRKT